MPAHDAIFWRRTSEPSRVQSLALTDDALDQRRADAGAGDIAAAARLWRELAEDVRQSLRVGLSDPTERGDVLIGMARDGEAPVVIARRGQDRFCDLLAQVRRFCVLRVC